MIELSDDKNNFFQLKHRFFEDKKFWTFYLQNNSTKINCLKLLNVFK